VASIASTAVLTAACGIGGKPAVSGTNATSHWIWGRAAWYARRGDLRHTVLGYAIHHASSVFWATLFEAWNAWRPPAGSSAIAGRALGVAAVAALVDYRVVPKRLTPGFEAHLGRPAIAGVYLAFAAGLACCVAVRRR
jgi:hypothetical protein